MLVRFSLSRLCQGRRCMLETGGWQLCFWPPIKGLPPRLFLANLGAATSTQMWQEVYAVRQGEDLIFHIPVSWGQGCWAESLGMVSARWGDSQSLGLGESRVNRPNTEAHLFITASSWGRTEAVLDVFSSNETKRKSRIYLPSCTF